jgi:endonuclease YncB( thermonuclease family)
MLTSRKTIAVLSVLCATLVLPAVARAQSPAMASAVAQAYGELFAISQKDKKGLMFYVRGQQIGGAVVRVIGNDAVEVRNQTYGRIIIRMDRIDAVAAN